jgi:hypothetical protein
MQQRRAAMTDSAIEAERVTNRERQRKKRAEYTEQQRQEKTMKIEYVRGWPVQTTLVKKKKKRKKQKKCTQKNETDKKTKKEARLTFTPLL